MRRYATLDQRLLAAVRAIRILATISWPASVEERLIAEFGAGRLSIPDIRYRPPDLGETRAELEAIEAEVDEDHPIAEYLRRTTESWRIATLMLDAAGTNGVTEASIALYGKPGDAIPGSNRSNLDAARYFVNLADELGADLDTEDATGSIPAEELRRDMSEQLDAFFAPGTISVEVDPELTAKAAAGATRIRLRGGVHFTEYDRHQLLAHEAFVHSLTALERTRAAGARVAGAHIAARDGDAGRAGCLRRADVGSDRHIAPEAHQPAYPRYRHGPQRCRFRRGVPLFPRLWAKRGGQFPFDATCLPRRAAHGVGRRSPKTMCI